MWEVLLILVLIVLIALVVFATEIRKSKSKSNKKNSKNQDSVATIVGIGDTLCHGPNFEDAYNSKTGEYDFSTFFKYITKHFDGIVNVGNLEVPFAGKDKGYSGYPTFNAPEHLAFDLKKLGLDIMTTANNHALDMEFQH